MVKKSVTTKLYEKPFGKTNHRQFLLVIGIFFALISASHLIRASLQLPMIIGVFRIPVYWSWATAIMAFIFSSIAFTLEQKMK